MRCVICHHLSSFLHIWSNMKLNKIKAHIILKPHVPLEPSITLNICMWVKLKTKIRATHLNESFHPTGTWHIFLYHGGPQLFSTLLDFRLHIDNPVRNNILSPASRKWPQLQKGQISPETKTRGQLNWTIHQPPVCSEGDQVVWHTYDSD